MNREQQKAFFAKLNANGFPVRHERTTDEEREEAIRDGIDPYHIQSHDHYVDLSQAMVLKELKSGKKSAEEIVDNLTGTKESERLRYDVRTPLPLIELQRMGKIKLVGNSWKLSQG